MKAPNGGMSVSPEIIQGHVVELLFQGDIDVLQKQIVTAQRAPSQNADQVAEKYLIEILDHCKIHSRHQARRSILLHAINELLQKGVFQVNSVLSQLVKGMSIRHAMNLWLAQCDLIETYLGRSSVAVAESVLVHLLHEIQDLPDIISPAVDNPSAELFPPNMMQMFSCAQRGVCLLQLYLQRHPPILPMYWIIVAVQKFYRAKKEAPHWILQPFVNTIFLRRQNLCSLLMPAGRLERCRLASHYRDDMEPESTPQVPEEHQMINEFTANTEALQYGSESYKRGVQTIFRMLCDQAPEKKALSNLIKSYFNVFPPPPGSRSSAFPSQMLLDAVIERTRHLVALTEKRMTQYSESAEQRPEDSKSKIWPTLRISYDRWWGEWQRFGNQFYTFVEERMIDFESFVYRLAQTKLRDDALVWLVGQCLMLEPLKDFFIEDIRDHNGRLTSTIFSLRSPVTSPKQTLRIRETFIFCFIYRLETLVTTPNESSYSFKVHDFLPSSVVARTPDYPQYRVWWQTAQRDSRFLEKEEAKLVATLLSYFTSQPISKKLYEVLTTKTETSSPSVLPGDVPFTGNEKPIDIYILACLAVKSHQRLLVNIEETLLDAKHANGESYAESPGLVETYARLLCLGSSADKQYKLMHKLLVRESEISDCHLHTLVEIVNFRLVPLFRFTNEIKGLTMNLHEALMTTKHQQTFNLLENYFIKATLCQTRIISFRSLGEKLDFGVTINRMLLLSLARTLKLHGASNFNAFLKKAPRMCKRLIQLTGAHTWERQRVYFPQKIQQILNEEMERSPYEPGRSHTSAAVSEPPVTLAQITSLVKSTQISSATLTEARGASGQGLDTRYFLPYIFCKKEKASNLPEKAADNLRTYFSNLPPTKVVLATYQLVDFILDEFLHGQRPRSVTGAEHAYTLSTAQEIQQCGIMLEEIMWNYKILHLERLLLAFSDRVEDPNALAFVDYFLSSNNCVLPLVHKFLDQKISPRVWEEDDISIKMREYYRVVGGRELRQFQFAGQPYHPIYYGCLPLRLLPVLDCLIMRFIEANRTDLLEKLLNPKLRYVELYQYHEGPVTFVKELLQYYYGAPQLSHTVKNALLRIVAYNKDVELSSPMAQLRESIELNGPDFVRPISSIIQTQILSPLDRATRTTAMTSSTQGSTNVPFHTFREFATTPDRVLHTCVLEILLLPWELESDIVQAILEPLKIPTRCLHLSFTILNAMGLLLASLQETFSITLLKEAAEILCTDPLLVQLAQQPGEGSLLPMNASGGPFAMHLYTELANLNDSMNNRSSALMTLMHSYLHYASIEVFENFHGFILYVKGSVRSYYHLYILCRLFAPWLYRISQATETLDKILGDLLDMLALVDSENTQSSFELQCDITEDQNDPNSIFWLQEIIVDFLFHVYNISVHCLIQAEKRDTAAALIDQLSPSLRAKFRYFFMRR